MAKKQALGRGLSALLPDNPVDITEEKEQITVIDMDRLVADPNQPRREFDDDKLAELAGSIKEVGVMQPLLVVQNPQGDYRIVAGERRYRAARIAGLNSLPCIVRSYDEQQLAEISLIENIQREDLTALEEAAAYRRLMDSFDYTQDALSRRLGKSRSYVANTLRLLQLPPHYRNLLEQGRLTPGHARAILSLRDPDAQTRLTDAILAKNLSVRQTEELARQFSAQENAAVPKEKPKERKEAPHIKELEKRFTSAFGLPAHISGSLNKGKLQISYCTADDLENLIEKLLDE